MKPVRLDVRGGRTIVCNRQLLVSNAFEEWLAEKCSWLHRPLRKNYDRVGGLLHRHYYFFSKKMDFRPGVYRDEATEAGGPAPIRLPPLGEAILAQT